MKYDGGNTRNKTKKWAEDKKKSRGDCKKLLRVNLIVKLAQNQSSPSLIVKSPRIWRKLWPFSPFSPPNTSKKRSILLSDNEALSAKSLLKRCRWRLSLMSRWKLMPARKIDKKLRDYFNLYKNLLNLSYSAWSPSGKARVCKTLIREFNSPPGLTLKIEKLIVKV